MKYSAEEQKVIDAAMSIIQEKMKVYGLEMTSSGSVKSYLRLRLANLQSEEFHVMFLTCQHKLIASEKMFSGTIDGASVYPREIVKKALEHNAGAIIIAHNHPSGESSPSSSDINITRRITEACNLIDVRVLDHVVVGDDTFSFAEKGMM